MMEIKELQKALLAKAKSRPDLYLILSMTTGIKEKRIREIAKGKGEPATISEIIVLSAQAGAR